MNKQMQQDIGNRIQTTRKSKGLNQKALADLLQCSQPEISNIESGKRGFTEESIKKIATVLKCDPQVLMKGDSTATNTTTTSSGATTNTGSSNSAPAA